MDTTTEGPTAATYAAAVAGLGLPPEWETRVRVSTRRRSLGVTVVPGQPVTIAVPAGATPERVAAAVAGMRFRIVRMVAELAPLAPDHPVKELVGGEGFPWLGTNHRLRLVDDGPAVCQADGPSTWSGNRTRWLHLRRNAASARTVIGWYQAAGLEWLERYARPLADRAQVRDGLRVEVGRYSRRKWAHYDPRTHAVMVTWPVFQLPRELVEYVITHEVAHATRPPGKPHGPEWERVMDRLMFDWRERRTRLGLAGARVWVGDVAAPAPAADVDDWGAYA